MPATTPRYQLPYLQSSDVPDLGYATQTLAEATDAALAKDRARMLVGLAEASISGVTSSTVITFPAGHFTRTPMVLITRQGHPSGSAKVQLSVTSPSKDGFTLFLSTVDSSAATVAALPCAWAAIEL